MLVVELVDQVIFVDLLSEESETMSLEVLDCLRISSDKLLKLGLVESSLVLCFDLSNLLVDCLLCLAYLFLQILNPF